MIKTMNGSPAWGYLMNTHEATLVVAAQRAFALVGCPDPSPALLDTLCTAAKSSDPQARLSCASVANSKATEALALLTAS